MVWQVVGPEIGPGSQDLVEVSLSRRDVDNHVCGHPTLAGQTGIGAKVLGLLQHVELIFGNRFQRLKALHYMNMTAGAAAVSAAIMVYSNIVVQSGVEQNSTGSNGHLGVQRQKHDFRHNLLQSIERSPHSIIQNVVDISLGP